MIERLPSRSDSISMLALAPESKDFMLLTLKNGPGSSKYVFSGKRNRKYLFQRRTGERRHTLLIPKSVWDADDAEVAVDILSRNTDKTIIVQHVTLADANKVILHKEADGEAPAPQEPSNGLPEIPQPSDDALQAAAKLIHTEMETQEESAQADAILDEDDPLPDVMMPEGMSNEPVPFAKPVPKKKGK